MKHVIMRKPNSSLGSVRSIHSKMENRSNVLIRNSRLNNTPLLRNDIIDKPYIFNWGNYGDSLDRFTNYNIINDPRIISETSNKILFRQTHVAHVPYTMYNVTDVDSFYTNIESRRRRGLVLSSVLPKLIIRPKYHSQGRDLYVANNMMEFLHIKDTHFIDREWYASVFIDKEKEFRVFVVQGRVVYIVEKIVEDPTQPAWNTHAGSRFENVRFSQWNKNVVSKALQVMIDSGLTYGAVDVILDRQDHAFVLEINTSSQQESEYWTTCIAKTFDYIIDNRNHNNIDVDLQDVNNTEGSFWRKVIHPAISDEAEAVVVLNNNGATIQYDNDNGFRILYDGSFIWDPPITFLEGLNRFNRTTSATGNEHIIESQAPSEEQDTAGNNIEMVEEWY